MIQNSFVFLERVKKGVEQGLHKQGISSWDSFLDAKCIKGISRARKLYYDRKIIEARKALYNFDSAYFKKILPRSEYYLLYDFFKEDAVFLDIETTGLDFRNNDITVIGLFDGIDTKTMVKNINLDYKKLKNELEKYKLIVTFNGSSFDVPFINKIYPNLLPKVPNFDIKSVTDRLNLKGGLKAIEKKLGIRRSRIVEKFSGGDALRLWKMYRATSDDYYLKLLIEYNEEDIVNLKKVADYCVKRLREKLENSVKQLPSPR
ncbi:ribonuclease H-like domain-containing protein [Candidatus Woesearchaeota archaeon]|nr:ribonuclease H-like domain-containing protein [Candidatus Woesearchaeota archaeon]